MLVTGCGPIGLCAVGIARAAGASLVVATDTEPYRLELARTMGADLALDAADGSDAEADPAPPPTATGSTWCSR